MQSCDITKEAIECMHLRNLCQPIVGNLIRGQFDGQDFTKPITFFFHFNVMNTNCLQKATEHTKNTIKANVVGITQYVILYKNISSRNYLPLLVYLVLKSIWLHVMVKCFAKVGWYAFAFRSFPPIPFQLVVSKGSLKTRLFQLDGHDKEPTIQTVIGPA